VREGGAKGGRTAEICRRKAVSHEEAAMTSKDRAPNPFWCTLSGQNKEPDTEYCLNLGRIVMDSPED
jgi:hypothetical protein